MGNDGIDLRREWRMDHLGNQLIGDHDSGRRRPESVQWCEPEGPARVPKAVKVAPARDFTISRNVPVLFPVQAPGKIGIVHGCTTVYGHERASSKTVQGHSRHAISCNETFYKSINLSLSYDEQ